MLPNPQEFKAFCLPDWLGFLENRHQKTIQFGLERVKKVAHALNLVHWSIPVVTIAGTNGKGSTIAALEAIYVNAGYQVGSYTSPHLFRFNERIRHNKQAIDDNTLCDIFLEIEHARGDTPLTYFEVVTLASLYYFKQRPLDVILLEVGMGGRLDATNFIDPDVAVITTIDFDHQEFLGNTLEQIGYEKAGIIRPNKPVIFADYNMPHSIQEYAHRLNAPLYKLGVDFKMDFINNQWVYTYCHERTLFDELGIHQQSAAAALTVVDVMQSQLPVKPHCVVDTLECLRVPGRRQIIKGEKTILLDVAHNKQSALLLADTVRSLKATYKHIYAVFSALKDKDVDQLIKPLSPFIEAWFPCMMNNVRAADDCHLQNAFHRTIGYMPKCYRNPIDAYQAATNMQRSEDMVLIYGSFYLIGQLVNESKSLSQRIMP